MISYTCYFKAPVKEEQTILEMLDSLDARDECDWRMAITQFTNRNGQYHVKDGQEIFIFEDSSSKQKVLAQRKPGQNVLNS